MELHAVETPLLIGHGRAGLILGEAGTHETRWQLGDRNRRGHHHFQERHAIPAAVTDAVEQQ